MNHRTTMLIAPIILFIASLACNAPFVVTDTPQAAATADVFLTSAMQTIEAASTQPFSSDTPSSTPFPTRTPTSVFTSTPTRTPTPTSVFTSTPTRTPTPTSTFTPTPTSTPTSIFTSTPTSTPTPTGLCDAAAFIQDVSIPDGTIIGVGTTFTKTWRIQNVGTCTWTTSYALTFVSGNQLSAPGSVIMPGPVSPGQMIDISVTMTAPGTIGNYQGNWKLRNASGILFGVGPQAQVPLFTDINVIGPSYTIYDFAAHSCDANWDNTVITLPCPGTNGDGNGYVIKLDHPTMENGQTMDQPGLLTVPSTVNNGNIRGRFPAFNVQNGDHFQSLINCQYQAFSCNVFFRLDYQIGGGSVLNLGQWNEIDEGQYTSLNIDLSALAGQNVNFILTVTTNGLFNQDYAIWFAPHIIRVGTPPTPSFTPTPTPTFTPTPTPTITPSPTQTSIP